MHPRTRRHWTSKTVLQRRLPSVPTISPADLRRLLHTAHHRPRAPLGRVRVYVAFPRLRAAPPPPPPIPITRSEHMRFRHRKRTDGPSSIHLGWSWLLTHCRRTERLRLPHPASSFPHCLSPYRLLGALHDGEPAPTSTPPARPTPLTAPWSLRSPHPMHSAWLTRQASTGRCSRLRPQLRPNMGRRILVTALLVSTHLMAAKARGAQAAHARVTRSPPRTSTR